MKKLMIVLCIALLMSVTIGLSAQDMNFGLNLKGFDTVDPMVSVELGFGGEAIVSPYVQIGIAQASGLAGLDINLGKDSPLSIFAGAGVTLGQKTVTTSYSVPVDSTGSYESKDITITKINIDYELPGLFRNRPANANGRIEELTTGTGYANVSGTANFDIVDSYMVALPTAEIGMGIEMGFIYNKLGFVYVGNGETNNYGFTISMGASW